MKTRGHESISEHASATFRITCDRACTHQLVRHRIAAYSQESQRYCNYTKKEDGAISFIMPHNLPEGDSEQIIKQFMAHSEKTYNTLIALGCKPEQARAVLPNCTKTEIVATLNFRSWKHFINIRKDKHAQSEIREIALGIEKQLANICPSIFEGN